MQDVSPWQGKGFFIHKKGISNQALKGDVCVIVCSFCSAVYSSALAAWDLITPAGNRSIGILTIGETITGIQIIATQIIIATANAGISVTVGGMTTITKIATTMAKKMTEIATGNGIKTVTIVTTAVEIEIMTGTKTGTKIVRNVITTAARITKNVIMSAAIAIMTGARSGKTAIPTGGTTTGIASNLVRKNGGRAGALSRKSGSRPRKRRLNPIMIEESPEATSAGPVEASGKTRTARPTTSLSTLMLSAKRHKPD